MDIVISFFRDTLSGWFYIIYLIVCLIFVLAIIGLLGDKKKQEIRAQVKKRKIEQLLSGEAAAKASLEGKQVIDVISQIAPTPSVHTNNGDSRWGNSNKNLNNFEPIKPNIQVQNAEQTNSQEGMQPNIEMESKVVPLVINGDIEKK